MFSLKGMNALVTGAAGGIGSAIAHALASQGARLALSGSNSAKLRAFRDELNEAYPHHDHDGHVEITCDLGNTTQVEELIPAMLDTLGTMDILVNNAGITRDATLRKMDKVGWDAVLRTNLDSMFNVTKPFIDPMVERGWGRIINVSSINGSKGQFGQTNYSAAKAGVHGFTKALALEVARKGVTVNTVSPGYLATEMVMAVREDVRQKITDAIPVGRLGQPAEIAELVAFIASEAAAFMTGSNVAMNGGQHMY